MARDADGAAGFAVKSPGIPIIFLKPSENQHE